MFDSECSFPLPQSDVSLTADRQAGRQKISWAWEHMPVLQQLSSELESNKSLNGLRIAVSVHVEAKTACLAKTLAAGGAQVALTGCNPLSTQDDVAAALAEDGIVVCARHGVDEGEYRRHLESVLSMHPHIVIDDGGDLAQILHTDGKQYADQLIGGCEETTTGIRRLKSLEDAGSLQYPVIAINDARCKHLFDNRYGTGQSVWTAIMSLTNLIVAGKMVVVAGYGLCGRGVALRAKGLGARVIVTEIDAVKACEALMDGFDVMPMLAAASLGDLFITVTGCKDVITTQHYKEMKNGAILCNAGHFDVEINLKQLAALSVKQETVRPGIQAYFLADGKRIHILASGRLVNLAGGDGHPAEIMDMSFSLQTAGVLYLAREGKQLPKRVLPLPADEDEAVAKRLLQHWHKGLEQLTPEQDHYLNHWNLTDS